MEEGVPSDLGAAARCVVDVIALQCDEVAGAEEQDGPVMMPVASRAPGCGAVEFGVGYRYSVRGAVAGDEHLSADERDLWKLLSDKHSDEIAMRLHALTWSTQTKSAPSRVMASPPQMYCGLSSVMWTFWMMMFLAPLAIRRPFPRITPEVPIPMRDLLDPRLMGDVPALS